MLPLLLMTLATIIGLVALILIPTSLRSFKKHRPMRGGYGLERRRLSLTVSRKEEV